MSITKRSVYLLVIILSGLLLVLVSNELAHAQGIKPLFTRPEESQAPPFTFLPKLSNLIADNADLLNSIFGILQTVLATIGGTLAFVYIFWGGYKYLLAGPNPESADEGKKMIAGAIVGLVIIALAYVLINYVREQVTTEILMHSSQTQ
jgi:hypothetical protein